MLSSFFLPSSNVTIDTFNAHAETTGMVPSKDSFEIPEIRQAEAAYVEEYCLMGFGKQTLAGDLEALHRLLFPTGQMRLPILQIQFFDLQADGEFPFPAHGYLQYQEQADLPAPGGDLFRALAGNELFPRGGNEVFPPAGNNSATPGGNNSATTAINPFHAPGGHPIDDMELDEELPIAQDHEQLPQLIEADLHEHDNTPDVQQVDDPGHSLGAMLEVRDHSTWGMIGNAQQYKQVFSEYHRINDGRTKNSKSDRVALDDVQAKVLVEDLCRAMVDMSLSVELPKSESVKKVMMTGNLEIEFLAWMLLVSGLRLFESSDWRTKLNLQERCVDASAGELKIPLWAGVWSYNKDHHTFESRFTAV